MQFDTRKKLAVSGLILLAAFFAYSNSFRNKFVYDDVPLIEENQYIRNWNYLPKLLTKDMWSLAGPDTNPEKLSFYRPLPMISFLVENSIFGLNPPVLHLTNTLIHSANGILVFLITNSLAGSGYAAAAAGLLFVLHPAQTESVAFMSSRGEVLFLFFTLLAIFLFIRGKIPFSVISFCLALLSKETSLITPALIFLVSYYFAKEKLKIKYFIPYIAAAGLYFLLRILLLPLISQSSTFYESLNRFVYMMTMGLLKYIKILILPVYLSADYYIKLPVPVIGVAPLFSIGLSVTLIVFAFLTRKKLSVVSFSIFWFYAALIPSSHLLYPMPYLIAERQLYLPSIGYCILMGWIFAASAEKYKKAAVSVFVFLLFFYSIRTINRNFDWGDEVLLWRKVLKQFPDSPKASFNLGVAFSNAGNYEASVQYCNKALEMNYYPEYVRKNLATIYRNMNRFDLAVNEYKELLIINPQKKYAHNDLGSTYLKMGRLDDAISEYLTEIRIYPDDSGPYNSAGIAFAMKKDYVMAEKYFNLAVKIDPSNEHAKNNLALLYKEKKAGPKE